MKHLLSLLALLLVAACGERAARDRDQPPRSETPAATRGPRDARTPRAPWDEVAVIRVPSLSANRVASAMDAELLSDGGVVIADPSSGAVQRYDAAGTRLRDIVVRAADGGTSRSLAWLGVTRGDTVVTYDVTSQSFLLLAASGGNAARHTLHHPLATRLLPSVVSGDGVVVFARAPRGRASVPMRAGIVRDSEHVHLVDMHANSIHEFGPFPASEYVVSGAGGSGVPTPIPFGPELFATPCNDGVFVAWSADSIVTFAGWGGEVYDSIALPLPAVPMPPDAWRSALTALELTHTKEAARAIGQMVPPARLPRIAGFAADGCDRLWVRPYTLANDSTSVWLAYDRAGRVIDRESLAGSADIVRFRGRRVLVRSRAGNGGWEFRVYERRR